VGYRPNFQARALARGRSHTVGLIVSELSGGNPFFSEVMLYFERAAVEQGYEVLVSFADTETRPDHVAVCAERMQERQVEGIATLTFGMEEQLANTQIDVPVVYAGADHDLPGVRNVRINYVPGFKDAVKHLVDFGHQRIGYLSGRLRWSSMQSRLDALRKAMKAVGYAFDKELVAECDHTWDGGAQGMGFLLSLPKPPTAVLCCNDVAAVGALKTLAARGLHAGKDIALIGFDDLTICQYTQPPLTPSSFLLVSLPAWPSAPSSKKSSTHPRKPTSSTRRASCCANPPAPRAHKFGRPHIVARALLIRQQNTASVPHPFPRPLRKWVGQQSQEFALPAQPCLETCI
jgi:LacI family transcriptional regulator